MNSFLIIISIISIINYYSIDIDLIEFIAKFIFWLCWIWLKRSNIKFQQIVTLNIAWQGMCLNWIPLEECVARLCNYIILNEFNDNWLYIIFTAD